MAIDQFHMSATLVMGSAMSSKQYTVSWDGIERVPPEIRAIGALARKLIEEVSKRPPVAH